MDEVFKYQNRHSFKINKLKILTRVFNIFLKINFVHFKKLYIYFF